MRTVAVTMAVLLAVFTVYDIGHHMEEEGFVSWHSALEGLFLVALALLILVLSHSAGQEFTRADQELDSVRQELQLFRDKNRGLMTDYRQAVQDQFERWGYTAGERLVAEHLILGYSFKEIAAQLNKKEKTVRNQSQALYDKAGLTGRHDLAAFFLQDILGQEE